MKSNAPEKIYVPMTDDELHYHMTCPNNEFQESIEYTRTDVLIEKAAKWINEHTSLSEKMVIDNFVKYMKG